uniref:Uncharacterized protein n=1 Tax=Tanacetum cinerariifolium TaxID=118510 RepID=A0A699HWL4_TANCI|nr:hypothetical protein [Tanacetum cinerariifolium]
MSYNSISSDSDPSAWGISHMDDDEVSEMDIYEEVAQGGQAAPPLPAYVPDPIKLEHHVPVYIPEPVEDLVDDPEEELEEEPKEDLEEDPVDYVVDADDDEDEEEDSSEDDDDNEEEHLALTESIAVASPAVDLVPSTEETSPFETDESAATLPPPTAYRTTSRMSVRSHAPIPFPSEVEVARLFALPTPPPSPLTPLSSPFPQISSRPLPIPSPPTTSLTYTKEPLGYRAAVIRLRDASPLPLPEPSTSRRADILKADMPPWKRLLLTSPTPRFKVGKSFATAAARQPRSTVSRKVDYSCVDNVDASIRALERRSMAAIEMVNLRDADDHATGHIIRIQALEAGARVDTLEDTERDANKSSNGDDNHD